VIEKPRECGRPDPLGAVAPNKRKSNIGEGFVVVYNGTYSAAS